MHCHSYFFCNFLISSHIFWPLSFATCLCFLFILSTSCLWGAQEIIHEGISQAKILPTLLLFKSDHFLNHSFIAKHIIITKHCNFDFFFWQYISVVMSGSLVVLSQHLSYSSAHKSYFMSIVPIINI